MLKETLPTDLPVVFISSVTGQGIQELKDILWKELNSESNKLQEITAEDTLVHRDKDMLLFFHNLTPLSYRYHGGFCLPDHNPDHIPR